MNPEFFTTDEVAKKLRTTTEFVRREIKRGKFGKTHIIAREHRISQKGYEQYLENNSVRHNG